MTMIASTTPRAIAMVVFPGAQLLDASGPAEVFATANQVLGAAAYDVRLLSPGGGLVTTSAGVTIGTESLQSADGAPLDTLLVAGGQEEALAAALANRTLGRWLRGRAPTVRRFGSVCSGVFILAACGLAGGRRVATHWSAADRLKREHPGLRVDPNALFVTDGPLWTSGGVTAGIDMALAMAAADLGSDIAQATAQQMVLSVRRAGHQSQFSPALAAQRSIDGRFVDLVAWMQDNLSRRLDCATLAARANMSERSFQRRFAEAMASTPAQMVEKLRVDAARSALALDVPLKTVAAQVGFSSTTHLAAAFQRQLGLTPQVYRDIHCVARRDGASSAVSRRAGRVKSSVRAGGSRRARGRADRP